MQKKFIKPASAIIVIAMAITIFIVFIFQTFHAYNTGKIELDYLTDQVRTRLAENSEEAAQLTENTNEEFLAYARAFAMIIQGNPEVLESQGELNGMMKRLNVDELHVTDEKGVIRWSTVPDYIGFDMSSSGQAAEFMPAITDKSFELAQPPQPNSTRGILYQYVGVARYDKPGIVQIGMQPTRLESALANNEIGRVLERYDDGDEFVIALNAADMTVASHYDTSLVGKAAEEIGLPSDISQLYNSYSEVTVNGERLYVTASEMEDYIIVPAYKVNVMLSGRVMQMILLIASDIIVVLVMITAINRLLKKQIVAPVEGILKKLEKIGEGDFETTVDVRTCPEFSRFSNGINAMVQGIKERIDETHALLNQQRKVAENVMHSAGMLSRLSDGNMDTTQRLADGARQQTSAMSSLTDYITGLAQQMEADGGRASQASESSSSSVEFMRQGVQALEKLADAMTELDQMSGAIQQVVKATDDISFQTNILALNAAVEAARAGEAGKGFAVVADEVRSLASQSADSAKQTAKMIGDTTTLMHDGKQLSARAAEAVRLAMEKADEVKRFTGGIVEDAYRKAETIELIRTSGEQVSRVIDDNAALAIESKDRVANLIDQVRQLQSLANS